MSLNKNTHLDILIICGRFKEEVLYFRKKQHEQQTKHKQLFSIR